MPLAIDEIPMPTYAYYFAGPSLLEGTAPLYAELWCIRTMLTEFCISTYVVSLCPRCQWPLKSNAGLVVKGHDTTFNTVMVFVYERFAYIETSNARYSYELADPDSMDNLLGRMRTILGLHNPKRSNA